MNATTARWWVLQVVAESQYCSAEFHLQQNPTEEEITGYCRKLARDTGSIICASWTLFEGRHVVDSGFVLVA